MPAGATSFAVDLTFTSQLQLRLAYDIAALYGIPLDLEDPEDLWKFIRITFAIKAGEATSGVAVKAAPAFVRPLVRKVFSGAVLQSVRSLPVVGRYLLQRNLIKFSVPVVGIPLTAGTNYWLTKMAGEHAPELDALGAVRDTIQVDRDLVLTKIAEAKGAREHIYDGALLAAAVEGRVSREESELLKLLSEHCGTTFDRSSLRAAAKDWG
ncbi:hypothetical protein GCM10027055_01340 [Janibacter alkaliphilus]